MAHVDQQRAGNWRTIERRDKLHLSKTFPEKDYPEGGKEAAEKYCVEITAMVNRVLKVKYQQVAIDFRQLPLSLGQWRAIQNEFTIDCPLLTKKLRPEHYTETVADAMKEFCATGYCPRLRVRKLPDSSTLIIVEWWAKYFGPKKILTDIVKTDIEKGLEVKAEESSRGGRGRGKTNTAPVSLKTLDNYLMGYKSFSHWCLLEEKTVTRPELTIKKRAVDAPEPRPLGLNLDKLEQFDLNAVVAAMDALLAACKRADQGNETAFTRMHLFVLFALATGRRAAEILSLQWSHINLETGAYSVRVKGGKVQSFEVVGKALRELNALRETAIDGYIFTMPLSDEPFAYSDPFSAVIADAGLGDHYFHDLRDTCATIILNGSKDWSVVADVLGHSSVGSLQKRYARFFPGLIRSSMEKHLPESLR